MNSILSSDLLARVSRWAVWAALIEFMLLRVMIRFGPMLPPTRTVTQVARVVLLVGTVALNVAAILATLAVLVLAGLTRSNALRGLLTAAATLNVIRVVLPQGAAPVLDVIFSLYSVVALAAMIVTLMLCHRRLAEGLRFAQGDKKQALLHRVMLMILIVIYAALAYPPILATAARLGWPWAAGESSVVPHALAEGLAVVVALMAYFVYRPKQSKLAQAGAWIVTVLLGGFWLARPHLASALTQWTVDFTTFLPPWLYLLGLAGFLYTAMALARTNDVTSRFAAWGLTLVALGGLRWDYTYSTTLGLLGFLLLAQASCSLLIPTLPRAL